MEFFKSAKTIRLKSYHDKYLVADEDGERVRQDRSATSKFARWTVEFSEISPDLIRLKSCYGRYLTPSSEPFLLRMTGRKVIQTLPGRVDPAVEWEPIRDGFQVKLRTRYGHFLRANGGLPRWRNSVTHHNPHRTSMQDWVLWEVEIVDLRVGPSEDPPPPPPHKLLLPPPPPPADVDDLSWSSTTSPSKTETSPASPFCGTPHKSDGRTIYYVIAEDDGNVDNSQDHRVSFKGTSVTELTEKLEEETELSGVIVCSRNPLNGKLCPLRLHLPPNNTMMHVVVVQASSKVARSFQQRLENSTM